MLDDIIFRLRVQVARFDLFFSISGLVYMFLNLLTQILHVDAILVLNDVLKLILNLIGTFYLINDKNADYNI